MKFVVRYMGYGATPDERLNETRVVAADDVYAAISQFNYEMGAVAHEGEWYRVAPVGEATEVRIEF